MKFAKNMDLFEVHWYIQFASLKLSAHQNKLPKKKWVFVMGGQASFTPTKISNIFGKLLSFKLWEWTISIISKQVIYFAQRNKYTFVNQFFYYHCWPSNILIDNWPTSQLWLAFALLETFAITAMSESWYVVICNGLSYCIMFYKSLLEGI